jgi:hypothetical protein
MHYSTSLQSYNLTKPSSKFGYQLSFQAHSTKQYVVGYHMRPYGKSRNSVSCYLKQILYLHLYVLAPFPGLTDYLAYIQSRIYSTRTKCFN